MSIFAGSLSDKWNKKITMLVSDTFAAFCTITIFILLKTGRLEIWHLYCLNALNGLMNTVQQPASDVAITLLMPKKHYQKVSGLRSFSNALRFALFGTDKGSGAAFRFMFLAFAGIMVCLVFRKDKNTLKLE